MSSQHQRKKIVRKKSAYRKTFCDLCRCEVNQGETWKLEEYHIYGMYCSGCCMDITGYGGEFDVSICHFIKTIHSENRRGEHIQFNLVKQELLQHAETDFVDVFVLPLYTLK